MRLVGDFSGSGGAGNNRIENLFDVFAGFGGDTDDFVFFALTSQRHSEKLPEVAGTSQGNPGFYAVTRERPRESFFNAS